MTDEPLTEQERRALLGLVIEAFPRNSRDELLLGILSKIGGCDTVLVARRAYPSRAADTVHGPVPP